MIGRGHRMLLRERLIAHVQRHTGVRFAMFAGVAEAFRAVEPKGEPSPWRLRITSGVMSL